MKSRRKLLSVLLTLSLLVTLLVPMVGPAVAGATYTALTTPTVPDDANKDLGTIIAHTVAGAVYTGNAGKVNLKLPTDFEFDWTLFTVDTTTGEITAGLSNLMETPATYSGDDNGLYYATWKAYKIASNEVQIQLNTVTNKDKLIGNDGYMYIYLKNVKIPAGKSGEIIATFSAPSTSGFGNGDVVVGKVKSDGDVTVTVDEVNTFTDSNTITLRFKEGIAESFQKDSKSLKLRLPDGFEWSSVGTPTLLWGDSAWLTGASKKIDFVPRGRDLELNVTGVTGSGTYFSLPATITVQDETKAKYGDVTVTISGPTTVSPTSLVVARYAEMNASVKCENPLDVTAGKTEQEIGDIVIEEGAPASLVKGRSVTLTLPANAKWGALPNVTYENDIKIDTTKGNSGFDLVGTDGKTLKFWIGTQSTSKAGKITLKDAEVILAGDVTGDLVVEVGGTAAISGKVTVAKIVPPVTVKAEGKKDIKIGLNDQPVGDFFITEGKAEAIADGKNLEVTTPSGIAFSEIPVVEVTEGDLDIDEGNIRTTEGDTKLIIPIKAESTTASTIKISGIKFDVDRTVAVGDKKLKVGGLAVNEVNDKGVLDSYYGYNAGTQINDNYYVFGAGAVSEDLIFERTDNGPFPGVTTVASAVVATCVTPAPGEQNANAVFTIGDTKYTVNGVEKTMDVAPYIKNDRTYMPVRYVAEALGVASDNIMWNQADQTVVMIKGDRVVKLTIGSTTMYINGVAFNMDVAPELVDPGRTMLPIRWVGQALGATLNWDGATQTVTVTQ